MAAELKRKGVALGTADDAGGGLDVSGPQKGKPRVALPAEVVGPASSFRPHGSSEFLKDGAVIRIAVEGPFNVEGIDEFARKMLALFAQIPAGQAVVTLAEIRRTLVAPADAWERLEAHTRRVQIGQYRLLGTAWWVRPEVEGCLIFLPRAREMYRAAGRPFEVFEDEASANLWAAKLLARDG